MNDDGARILNACVATGLEATLYTQHFDTVAMCFSKGLGAPVGSVVAGDGETIERARAFRKRFGGAMRQSGIVAAAALYALDHNVERLREDHRNARAFAVGIGGIEGVLTDPDEVETNMVFFNVKPGIGTAPEFCHALEGEGVLVLPENRDRVRAVFHLDVTAADTQVAVAAVRRAAPLTSSRTPLRRSPQGRRPQSRSPRSGA